MNVDPTPRQEYAYISSNRKGVIQPTGYLVTTVTVSRHKPLNQPLLHRNGFTYLSSLSECVIVLSPRLYGNHTGGQFGGTVTQVTVRHLKNNPNLSELSLCIIFQMTLKQDVSRFTPHIRL